MRGEYGKRAESGAQPLEVMAWLGCAALAFVLGGFLLLGGLWLFGHRIEANKELARQTPSWVPLYPRAGRTDKEAMPQATLDPWKVEGVVTSFTSDAPEQVIAYYEGRLPALGFRVDPLRVEDDQVRLRGRLQGGRELEVSTGSNSQNTWIGLRFRWRPVGSQRIAKRMQKEPMEERSERIRHQIEHPALPAWIPVYPGTQAMGAAGREAGEVALHTEDAPEKVLGFYTDRLRAMGFAVEPRTEEAQVWKLHARRQDGSELTVQSGQGHTGTWIVLTYKDGG